MNNKIIIGGIVGGIAYFILGWIIYGMFLMDFMVANAGTATGVNKPEPDFPWLILGNLTSGFLMAMILNWAGSTTMAAGAKTGAIVGFLFGLSVDATMYGLTNLHTTQSMVADIVASTVMTSIGGAIIAMVMGRGGNAS